MNEEILLELGVVSEETKGETYFDYREGFVCDFRKAERC